jgi:hypothetical protein
MEEITITIKTVDGCFKKSVDVPIDMLIRDLGESAQEQANLLNVPCTLLDSQNNALRESDTVQSAGIEDGATLTLVPEAEGGGRLQDVSAPIYVPDREDIAILLVPFDTVHRLEEYRAEHQYWEVVMWTFIGSILGVIVNWTTSQPIIFSKVSVILLIMLTIFTVIAFASSIKYKKRVEKIKEKMEQQKTYKTLKSND